MFDRLVADYDRTTTGGVLIGRSNYFNEEGKMYARKESHATCGNCKGGWPIYGTTGDWMDEGFPLAKDMDGVLCPCGKNFVLAAGNSNAFYSESKDKAQTETYVILRKLTLTTNSSRFAMQRGCGLQKCTTPCACLRANCGTA
ncbi:PAAR domain-containing protein [Paraburkholderia flagellata]|uniref:PAAR domain-containing protein n=1 Tax=Paraburkholderia flagellata TaxID=2883241 RepID=UPI001F3E7B8A|nr:PAAR domain-containing protein [Paraburkholderia flagellata]